MNTEYALKNIETMLTNNMTSVLNDLKIENSSTLVAPEPQSYNFGEIDTNILTSFPAINIWSPYSRKEKNEQGFQVRRIWLRVLAWIVQNDVSNLHRIVVRYGDAMSRILRIETNWNNNLFNPVIEDLNNTDLYEKNIGYAQGCLLEATIDYVLGEY